MAEETSFRLAYEEAVRAVRAQADTLGGIRQRAGTVLATSVVVTAFFGGQAVASGATPSSTGWLAVVAFVVTGLLSVAVLFPADPTFTTDVEAVVSLAERGPAERDVALMLWRQHHENRGTLVRLHWLFRAGAVGLLAEALLWITFLAES